MGLCSGISQFKICLIMPLLMCYSSTHTPVQQRMLAGPSCPKHCVSCLVASVWSLLRSEAGCWLMLLLMIIQRNDHIMNILYNVVWVSLFLWTKEFWQHPNSCTKLLPRIDVKSEKGWEPPCHQNGFRVPHVGIGKRWRKSKDSCPILTQGSDPGFRELAGGQTWNPD